MESFYVKDLVKAINGRFLLGDPKMLVRSISIDSRTVRKGQFYFAIKGKNFDGHDFIKEAVEREVGGIIYSRDDTDFAKPFPCFPSIIKVEDTLKALGDLAKAYRARFEQTKIVGITGSNGKTTTKEMLYSILNQKAKTICNKGNFNNRIGLPLSVLNLTSDVAYAVFEMGTSLQGEIKILSEILKPDVGIITNIGFSHLETFGSPEGVFKEKRALFDSISPDGFIVLNNDDEILKRVPSKTYPHVITFALYGGADVFAKNITIWADKPRFELHARNNSINITLPVKGRFNIMNSLAAAAVAIGFGFSLEEIKEGLETFLPPTMRMETSIARNGVILINDAYNANPSSVKEAIKGVCETYMEKEINLVLGDMLELGENSNRYHKEVGEFINTQRIKSVYLLGQESIHIKEAIDKKLVFHAGNQEELIKMLDSAAVNQNSVFLFKGSRSMKIEDVYNKYLDILDQRKK